MKTRRILAFAVAIAMVLSIVPAFGITASAAVATYSATSAGHSGSASGSGIFVGVGGGSMTASGNEYGAPKIAGTTVGTDKAGLGSNRIGFISFTVPVPEEDVVSATMKLYVTGVNGNLGSAWMKLAAYRTTGAPSSVTVGGMDASGYAAVDGDYSYDAAYWTNEQISSSNTGWKTIDVTAALNAAIEEATGDTATLSFRLQVPQAGLNFATAESDSANQPVLELITGRTVDVTWTLEGEVFDTATYGLDNGQATAPAKLYSANGSNVMYASEEQIVTEDTVIALSAVENDGYYEIGDVIAYGGVQYEIKSGNLIPNADFTYGIDGWYAADGNAAKDANFTTDAETGSVTLVNNGGSSSAYTLQRAWAIEEGKTYVYTYTHTCTTTDKKWQRFSLGNEFKNNNDAMILGAGAGDVETGQSVVDGTNMVVFTNTEGYAYANFFTAWSGGVTFSDFGLYEVEEAQVQATEEIEAVDTIDEITVFGSEEVVLPATVKVAGTLGSNVDAVIQWDVPEEYGIGTIQVNGVATVQFGTQEPIERDVTVNVTILDGFALPDSSSVNNQPGNVVLFPVDITSEFVMEYDYTINQIKDVSMQMGYNGTIFGNGAVGISPNKSVLNVTGGNKEGTSEGVQLIDSVSAGETYHMVLTMDVANDEYSLIVELQDGTVTTIENKGFRKAHDAINSMTLLTNGGGADGDIEVKNITVGTTGVELCTVTVDGEEKQVIKGRSYKKEFAGVIYDDAGTMYTPFDGVVVVPVDGDIELTTKALGLEMVAGAQVRIGDTELGADGKLDALADSGIRFIATVDYSDTVAAMDNVEFGIKVGAEESDEVVYIPAETFQNDEKSVFSAAITNLSESNYNRKYTAVAYAKLNGEEITSAPVTRSIYQVSAGIMKNGAADAENAPYTDDGVIENILNAYINQTGIRLDYDKETYAVAVEEGKYTGDVFFTVTSEEIEGGARITIAPEESWATKATIASWWTDYVRFNNNNSISRNYISNANIDENGILTFDFIAE